MPSSPDGATRGGFLLGTNVETYLFYIENAFVNILENDGETIGFAIVFPDELLRQSELWQRKNEIVWENGFPIDLVDRRICYIEQVAVLPELKYRFYGAAVVLATMRQSFETHEAAFTTLVIKPVFNPAAIPFLENVGARKIGTVDEFLPEFGNLVLAVYALERKVFREQIKQHRLTAKLVRQIEFIGDS